MSRFIRLLMIGVLPVVFAACTEPYAATPEASAAPPALGVDLGRSAARGPQTADLAAAGEGHEHVSVAPANTQVAHDGRKDVHGIGKVNSVNAAQHKLNLSHDPIAEIGWPAMTMDFPVAPSVDLQAIKPGMRVNFTIEQGLGGMYQIQSIAPTGGGR
jgi:Cu/Ag efflux protein CusF